MAYEIYSGVSISGYNDSPPSDDGSKTSANQVKWSSHKTKLADPVKTLAESMNTSLVTAFTKRFMSAYEALSSDHTLVAADFGKFLDVTGTTTITLPDATSVEEGWCVAIRHGDNNTLTIDGHESQTVNGSANLQLTRTNAFAILMSDGSNFVAIWEEQLSDFDSGTLAFFQQTAAPAGWTKQTDHNDKALRVVSGSVSSGGSSAFSTVFGLTATDAHTLTEAQIPSHNHSVSDSGHTHTYNEATIGTSQSTQWGSDGNGRTVYGVSTNTGSATTGISLGSTGGGGSHSHNIDLRVQYVDVIIASRD